MTVTVTFDILSPSLKHTNSKWKGQFSDDIAVYRPFKNFILRAV